MPERKNRIVVLIAATAAAGAGGAVIAAAAQKSQPTGKSQSSSRIHHGFGHRHGFGPQGRDGRRMLAGDRLDQIATKIGVNPDQLKAALDAARPNRPTKDDKRGAREQGLAEALATELGVGSDAVLKILQDNRPQRPTAGRGSRGNRGHHRGRPDMSRLVTALAKGLGKDETTVKAALVKMREKRQEDRTERRDQFFGKIATELGVDAAKVKTAFESVLGRPPAPVPPAPGAP